MDDNRLNRFEDKLDKILEKVSDAEVTLAAHAVMLESASTRIRLLDSNFQPVKDKVSMIQGAIKFIGIVATVIGVVAAVSATMGQK